MEGWLQVPPSGRDLIGRAQWKYRYVRFCNSFSSSRSSVSTTASSTRPTTAGSMTYSIGGTKPGLERSHSAAQVAALISNDMADERHWALAIYKQKTDSDPIVSYPVQRIASCYVGDIADKKKSLVLPTLVVNLRPPEVGLHHSSSSSSTSRTFRRRSHEASPRDGPKRDGNGAVTLYFRPNAEEPYCLERWSREIQSRIIPTYGNIVRSTVDTTAFREAQEQLDGSPLAPSPASLFLVNGEPNTALLSPSLRSKNSNLSSISSDGYSPDSSESEVLGSPRTIEDNRRQSRAPSHHVRSSTVSSRKGSGDTSAKFSPEPAVTPTAGRRETILDRFFSTAGVAVEPEGSAEKQHMSSMARFEALMSELERTRGSEEITSQALPTVPSTQRPRRIPSPTQRALEFVSTGQGHLSLDQQFDSPTYIPSSRLSPVPQERSDSDNVSLDTLRTAFSNSTTGTSHEPTPLPIPQGKRHSLADFSLMRLATPPLFRQPRRGSYGDLTHLSEDVEEEEMQQSPQPTHLTAARPLFREFSF